MQSLRCSSINVSPTPFGQDVVAEFDTSGDGVLDRDELLAALIRLDGGTMSVYQAKQLMG